MADSDQIIVTGRAQRLYRTETTTVGKSAEDPLDIPQALQVINKDLFADQGARDATDIYRNISGVSFFSYAGVTFRGFRQDQSFYDGMRGNPFIGFSVPQLFNIERVEVLKGPAGLFFGPGSPGGIINYVSKVPGDASACAWSRRRAIMIVAAYRPKRPARWIRTGSSPTASAAFTRR